MYIYFCIIVAMIFIPTKTIQLKLVLTNLIIQNKSSLIIQINPNVYMIHTSDSYSFIKTINMI